MPPKKKMPKSIISIAKSDVLEKKTDVLEIKSAVSEKKADILEKESVVSEKKPDVLEKESVVSQEKSDVLEKESVVSQEKSDVSDKKTAESEENDSITEMWDKPVTSSKVLKAQSSEKKSSNDTSRDLLIAIDEQLKEAGNQKEISELNIGSDTTVSSVGSTSDSIPKKKPTVSSTPVSSVGSTSDSKTKKKLTIKKSTIKAADKLEKEKKEVKDREFSKKLENLYEFFSKFSNLKLKDDIFEDRIKMENWILSDRNKLPEFLTMDFSEQVIANIRRNMKIWDKSSNKWKSNDVFGHQKFVSDYLSSNSPYRGLLLYHGLGSGKSGASIMIAEGILDKEVVVLLPKSLRNNYEDEITKFGQIGYRVENYWRYVEVFLHINEDKNKEIYDIFKEKGISEKTLKKILEQNKNRVWFPDNVTQEKNPKYIGDETEPEFLMREPNFNEESLGKDFMNEIKNQCKIMRDEKYKFIHYNMGASLLTRILKDFYSKSDQEKIKVNAGLNSFTDSAINKGKKNRYKILDSIYDPKNNLPGPFDNKVIVIDEVHNLVSMMAGKGINGPILYEILMRAKNCKIIFLSGTPCINYPIELGLLFNILVGYTISYKIKIKGEIVDEDIIKKKILENCLLINRLEINKKNSTIIVSRNPEGFISNFEDGLYKGVKKVDYLPYNESLSTKMNDEEFLEEFYNQLDIKKIISKDSIDHNKTQKQYSSIFPDYLVQNSSRNSFLGVVGVDDKNREAMEELFNDFYIDIGKENKGKSVLFKKNIIGLTSFYNEISGKTTEADPCGEGCNVFPEIIPKLEGKDKDNIVPNIMPDIMNTATGDIELSDYQFLIYQELREIERKMEEAQKKKGKKKSDSGQGLQQQINSEIENKTTNLFRVFSRQTALFTFPPNINRPRIRQFKTKDEIKRDKEQKLLKAREVYSENKKEMKKTLINLFCNLEDDKLDTINEKKKNLIDQFLEDITNTPEDGETFEQLSNEIGEIQMTREALSLDPNSDEEKLIWNAKNNEDRLNIIIDFLCELEKTKTGDEFDDGEETDNLLDTDLTYETACMEAISKLTKENLTCKSESNSNYYCLDILSPKLLQLLKNIDSSPGLIFCYSQFRSVEGIGILKKILDFNGYSEMKISKDDKVIKDERMNIGNKVRYSIDENVWKTGTISESDGDKFRLIETGERQWNSTEIYRCFYALWSGTESDDQKAKAKEVFNRSTNKFGQECLILLATSAGAEGISLKHVRQVHICEPYWNNVKLKQVIGRARRHKSHIELPPDQQNVTVYQYISKFSQDQLEGKWTIPLDGLKAALEDSENSLASELKDQILESEETDDFKANPIFIQFANNISHTIATEDHGYTSDQVLSNIAIGKSMIINNFLKLLKEASIDCVFNKEQNLLSNPDLSELECLSDIGVGEMNFNYSLDFQNTLETVDKDTFKRETLTLFIQNHKFDDDDNLKILYFLPNEFKSLNEYFIRYPKNIVRIYNFYQYYNIDFFNQQTQFRNKNEIGQIIVSENKQKIIWDKKFLDNNALKQHYKNIQKMIDEKNLFSKSNLNFNESEMFAWKNKIEEEYKLYLIAQKKKREEKSELSFDEDKTKWFCSYCHKVKKLPEADCYIDYDILICPNCNKFTKERAIKAMAGKQHLIESTKK